MEVIRKETKFNEIYETCLCRNKEVELILNLLDVEHGLCVNNMFVYGNTSTGKTHIFKTIMESLNLQHSYVNCIESFTSKHVYQKILHDGGNSLIKSCTTMVDFLRHLKNLDIFTQGETFYIILDKAERLRNMDSHLLPAFLRMAELSSLNICVILLSDIILEKFLKTTSLPGVLKIYLADYTKAELVTLMMLDYPSNFSKDFYSNYCKLLVDVFYTCCKDLNELRYLAIINFDKYCEPISTGELLETDIRKLWQKIGPHLRKALQTVYLREVSSIQWESMQQQLSVNRDKAQVELPYYSKYLLLAAYFASYNSATSDKRFFAKKSYGKMSKRAKTSVKSAKKADKKMTGPKYFQIDRLMAIFHSIIEGGAIATANILSQLATLVTLTLLTKSSADEQVDSPKYKCVVPLDFVVAVGKQVNVDVMQYLED